jgi:hypothetical protein
MATKVGFGYGKSNDWSSDNWSTLTNVQDTEITTITGKDGWKVLAFAAPTASKSFASDFTGWTETSGGSADSSISASSLLQTTVGTGRSYTFIYKDGFGSSDNSLSVFTLSKISTYSTYTGTNSSQHGLVINFFDGTRFHGVNYRSDGTNEDLYCAGNTGGTASTKHDGSQPISTTRWRIRGFYNNNGDNSTVHVINGKEEFTNGETVATTNVPGYLRFHADNYQSNAAIAHNIAWTSYFNSITPWETSDGVMVSKSDNALFDAVAGNTWQKLYFEHDVSNSTAIKYEVRCAASSGGLADASYETIAASGDSIVTQARYIQIKITFEDASSGQYTPILKTLEPEYDTGGTPTAAQFLTTMKGIL